MDWNERYENNDTPWDRNAPAPPLFEYLEGHSLSGRVLVSGCGTGSDARLLASHGCDVLGIDIAPLALERAKGHPAPEGGKLSFQLCDFLDPGNGLPNESFDALFEHTCFCAIDPNRRKDYVAAAERLLKPNGYLLGIFFTHLDNDSGPPYPTSNAEIERLFGPAFSFKEQWRPTSVFEGREGEETVYLMRRK